MAIYGYLRWLNNEGDAPQAGPSYTRTLLVISILLLAVVARGDAAGGVWRINAGRGGKAIPVFSQSAPRWPGFAPCWATAR